MMEGFGEIMTLEETTKYLKIGKSTLYKMAREGKIPAVKIEIGEKEIHGHKSSKTIKSKDFVCFSRRDVSALSANITPKCHHISTMNTDITRLLEGF